MHPDNIHIVLVGTTHPGNIGSTARAMKTMGLRHLDLVQPAQWPDERAEANAAQAKDVLAAAKVHDDLEAALQQAGLVIGLTARPRRWGMPALDPRDAAELAALESRRHSVALVFGRERSGLTNAELDRCHRLVHIPANPDYSSLNLACAVQIMAYELYRQKGESAVAADQAELATHEHLEGFYRHVEAMIELVDFAPHQPREVLMRRLRRLFNRARPEAGELDLLRGLFGDLERTIKRYQNGTK